MPKLPKKKATIVIVVLSCSSFSAMVNLFKVFKIALKINLFFVLTARLSLLVNLEQELGRNANPIGVEGDILLALQAPNC